jgi:hypothetical protein
MKLKIYPSNTTPKKANFFKTEVAPNVIVIKGTLLKLSDGEKKLFQDIVLTDSLKDFVKVAMYNNSTNLEDFIFFNKNRINTDSNIGEPFSAGFNSQTSLEMTGMVFVYDITEEIDFYYINASGDITGGYFNNMIDLFKTGPFKGTKPSLSIVASTDSRYGDLHKGAAGKYIATIS